MTSARLSIESGTKVCCINSQPWEFQTIFCVGSQVISQAGDKELLLMVLHLTGLLFLPVSPKALFLDRYYF